MGRRPTATNPVTTGANTAWPAAGTWRAAVKTALTSRRMRSAVAASMFTRAARQLLAQVDAGGHATGVDWRTLAAEARTSLPVLARYLNHLHTAGLYEPNGEMLPVGPVHLPPHYRLHLPAASDTSS